MLREGGGVGELMEGISLGKGGGRGESMGGEGRGVG